MQRNYTKKTELLKYHLFQDQVKKCPSPKSIFKCNTHSRQYRSSYKFKASEQIAFVPIGRCHVRNSEISCIKNGNLNLKLEQDPGRSSLQQEFGMRIETSFQLTNRLPGFLTLGVDNDKNGLTWNRRWCILGKWSRFEYNIWLLYSMYYLSFKMDSF